MVHQLVGFFLFTLIVTNIVFWEFQVIWLMVLASSLVFISARPETSGTHSPTGTMATILKSHFENNGDGNFQWEFETSDGIKAQQTGHALPPNSTGSLLRSGGDDEDSSNDNGGEAVMGSYSYKAPNGEVISLSYIAGIEISS